MPSTAAEMSSTQNKNETGIFFVTTSDGSFPKSGVIRKRIRKQAMSKIAAERRQRGDSRQYNIGQYPEEIVGSIVSHYDENEYPLPEKLCTGISIPQVPSTSLRSPPPFSTPSYSSLAHSFSLASDTGQDRLSAHAAPFNTIPPPMQVMGYERMRIDYNFDVLDLSALTGFHLGQIASKTLSANPESLVGLLKCRQWSYFSYIPSQYGHSKCLDDAIHCIAVRIRQYVGGHEVTPSHSVIQLYLAALRSLQDCLDDPSRQLDSDVLCATEILAIYEVLFAISTN